MDNREIIEVDYGLASSYDDGIEINRKLTGKLRDSIMKHERSHGVGRYNKKDFMNDFQAKNSNFKESVFFCIRNPEAWIGFFPIMYSYYFKIFTWNSSAVYPFLYFGLIWSAFWYFVAKISFLQTLIAFTCLIVLINIVLLVVTHKYVKKQHSRKN